MSPSNISLFVSNLRLLTLDQRQDWPDLTEQTFDTKDALQNQKKRVSCTEWSLYRLFEIWDRDTTREVSQVPLWFPNFVFMEFRNCNPSFRLWSRYNL